MAHRGRVLEIRHSTASCLSLSPFVTEQRHSRRTSFSSSSETPSVLHLGVAPSSRVLEALRKHSTRMATPSDMQKVLPWSFNVSTEPHSGVPAQQGTQLRRPSIGWAVLGHSLTLNQDSKPVEPAKVEKLFCISTHNTTTSCRRHRRNSASTPLLAVECLLIT
jgi:hypothetical protein